MKPGERFELMRRAIKNWPTRHMQRKYTRSVLYLREHSRRGWILDGRIEPFRPPPRRA